MVTEPVYCPSPVYGGPIHTGPPCHGLHTLLSSTNTSYILLKIHSEGAPLGRQHAYHIQNSMNLVNKEDAEETMVSYCVTSLFTYITTMKVVETVRKQLLQGKL